MKNETYEVRYTYKAANGHVRWIGTVDAHAYQRVPSELVQFINSQFHYTADVQNVMMNKRYVRLNYTILNIDTDSMNKLVTYCLLMNSMVYRFGEK